jgi:hypothetical protein
VKNAVEIGRKHRAPFLLGTVDEGAPAAAADTGIGKAAVDPAKGIEHRLHRVLHRAGVGDIADAGHDLAGSLGHGCGGGLVLVRIAAPDRDVAATERKSLRDAKPDTAIAARDDGHAAGEVEHVHGKVSVKYDAHQLGAGSMDKPPAKIKYGGGNEIAPASAE